jgi:hypothetical protein
MQMRSFGMRGAGRRDAVRRLIATGSGIRHGGHIDILRESIDGQGGHDGAEVGDAKALGGLCRRREHPGSRRHHSARLARVPPVLVTLPRQFEDASRSRQMLRAVRVDMRGRRAHGGPRSPELRPIRPRTVMTASAPHLSSKCGRSRNPGVCAHVFPRLVVRVCPKGRLTDPPLGCCQNRRAASVSACRWW